MTVNYDGNCWLDEFDVVGGRVVAERLDAADVGFVMLEDGDRITLLANAPLPGARVLTGSLVDTVGRTLLAEGAVYCGPWSAAPPEPWCDEFPLEGA